MNCPYCDEATHPLAKFCSKCGLPLKEDTTVMGAYATDDTGPSPMVVGGGAVAIVAVALLIGWMGSRKNEARPTETVRREAAGSYPAPAAPSGLAMARFGSGMSPGLANVRPSGPSATYNAPVRWAWTPSPQPPRPVVNWTPEVAPPPVMLASVSPILFRQPTIVEPPKATAPAIPALPPDVYVPAPIQPTVGYDASFGTPPPANLLSDPNPLPPGYIVAPNGQVGSLNADGVFEPATDLAPSVSTGDERSMWVWDPVNERWAVESSRSTRGGRRVGGRAALGQPR